MSAPSRVHRASAQRRRAALLDAASELAAEIGAGAVTHRAVAARAGVPLSTTSYFFGSIDELVTEALRQGTQARVADFDAAEKAWVLGDGASIEESLEDVVDQMLASTPTSEGTLVEYYLAAGRQPALQDDITAVVSRFAARIEWQLKRMGATNAADVAWAIQAFTDGAMLHRLAGVQTDHRARLLAGLRALLAAAALADADYVELFERFTRASPAVRNPTGAAAS